MLRLLADELPAHWSLPLVWPIVFSFIAFWLMLKAKGVEKYEPPPKWKPIWLVPALVGLVFGVLQAIKLRDPVYNAEVHENGMKMTLSHFAAAVLPLLAIVAIWVYDKATRQSQA